MSRADELRVSMDRFGERNFLCELYDYDLVDGTIEHFGGDVCKASEALQDGSYQGTYTCAEEWALEQEEWPEPGQIRHGAPNLAAYVSKHVLFTVDVEGGVGVFT